MKNQSVAIVCGSSSALNTTKSSLMEQGFNIAYAGKPNKLLPSQLDDRHTWLCVIDAETDLTDEWYEASLRPNITFILVPLAANSSGNIYERIRDKLAEISAQIAKADEKAVIERACRTVSVPVASADGFPVWVVGSSAGGPAPLRTLFERIDEHAKAGFIVAQHIGERFLSTLVKDIGRLTGMKSKLMEHGDTIMAGYIYFVPPNKKFSVAVNKVSLTEQTKPTLFTPSIDEVMGEVSRNYGSRAGAIVLSGMSGDAASGSEATCLAGGPVLIQDPEEAVIRFMPVGALKAAPSAYVGKVDAIAEEVIRLSVR